MNLSCLHTHTTFCDGEDDVETFCRAAKEKNLHSLGFSAHAPITKKTGFVTGWHLRNDRLEEYLDAIRSAKKRWKGRLNIYSGLEVDFIDGLTGPADKEYREMGLDYLIGSVHYLVPSKGKPFTVDGPPEEFARGVRESYSGDGEAAMGAYWDTLEKMIAAGGFDILGHADLIRKNNGDDKWFNTESKNYLGRLSRIALLIGLQQHLVTEVNTGGLNRGKIKDTYPSPAFLKLLVQGASVQGALAPVIINADAHRAKDLNGHYTLAKETLRRAGFKETLLFEGRENGRPRWTPRPL
ncbi:histidinol-phosphatase [Spirochaetia bacterium]|nr:histidinol-phosphatase [Spirochaetia bacterium]